jgi:hypothetical protein
MTEALPGNFTFPPRPDELGLTFADTLMIPGSTNPPFAGDTISTVGAVSGRIWMIFATDGTPTLLITKSM